MKGNQGLEALAALCGGASKARTNEEVAPPSASPTLSQGSNQLLRNAPMPAPAAAFNAVGGGFGRVIPSSNPPVQAPTAPLLGAEVSNATVQPRPPPPTQSLDPSEQSGLVQQQWQQAMAAAAASAYGGVTTPAAATAAAALLSAASGFQHPGIPHQHTDNTANALIYHCIQAQASAAAAQAAQMAAAQQGNMNPSAAVALALAAGQASQMQQQQGQIQDATKNAHTHQVIQQKQQERQPQQQQQQQASSVQKVIPSALSPAPSAQTSSSTVGTMNSMQPPPPQSQVPPVPSISCDTSASVPPPSPSSAQITPASVPPPQPIAAASSVQPPTSSKVLPPKPPQQPLLRRPSVDMATEDAGSPSVTSASSEDKKQMKRIANRRSAQLSRKRKKLFIEELKEENDELRRKEQILRSIPDLIVVFDSAGKLWFVSHSVSRFLEYTPRELEGTSFWERLCDESVRLLKAAFMDALAARQKDMDTAPLGSGVWELRLVDKDGSHKVVTLNGVVHFSGEAPECVCSIRFEDENEQQPVAAQQQFRTSAMEASNSGVSAASSVSSNGGMRLAATSSLSFSTAHYQPLIRNVIKPQQSVISNGSSDDSVRIVRGKAPAAGANGRRAGGVRSAAQISDGDSVVSESGSE